MSPGEAELWFIAAAVAPKACKRTVLIHKAITHTHASSWEPWSCFRTLGKLFLQRAQELKGNVPRKSSYVRFRSQELAMQRSIKLLRPVCALTLQVPWVYAVLYGLPVMAHPRSALRSASQARLSKSHGERSK
jgi:hypothetical protein